MKTKRKVIDEQCTEPCQGSHYRCGNCRKLRGLPLSPSLVEGINSNRQGTTAQPGWLHRACLQFHFSGGSCKGDDADHAGQYASVQRTGCVPGERRTRTSEAKR